MKAFIILCALSTIPFVITTDENCNTSIKECEKLSEYSEYVNCVREHRSKRSTCQYEDYDNDSCSCDNYDCDSCSYSSCQTSCNSCCGQCCNTINTCSTNHCCHKVCHTTCKDTSCRNSCRKSCKEKLNKDSSKYEYNIHYDKSSSSPSHSTIVTNPQAVPSPRHNITTVIHLFNTINNTNLINIPVVVNNTNLNNFTTYKENQGYMNRYDDFRFNFDLNQRQQTSEENQKCCLVIGPRQCVPQEKYPFMRCFHIRSKQCGPVCQSPIVHYQQYEICDNQVNQQQQPCTKQTVYIPQPRPRCAYQQTWPYVTCGNNQNPSCEGCYNHYFGEPNNNLCSPFCYDDGYGAGPYYRQGPVYRPGYAHVPSCYQTGFNNYDYSFNMANIPVSTNGLGYPVDTYPGGFIFDNSTKDVAWDDQTTSFMQGSPIVQIPPREIQIEANYTPRGERFAEIKITKEDSDEETEDFTSSTTVLNEDQ